MPEIIDAILENGYAYVAFAFVVIGLAVVSIALLMLMLLFATLITRRIWWKLTHWSWSSVVLSAERRAFRRS